MAVGVVALPFAADGRKLAASPTPLPSPSAAPGRPSTTARPCSPWGECRPRQFAPSVQLGPNRFDVPGCGRMDDATGGGERRTEPLMASSARRLAKSQNQPGEGNPTSRCASTKSPGRNRIGRAQWKSRRERDGLGGSWGFETASIDFSRAYADICLMPQTDDRFQVAFLPTTKDNPATPWELGVKLGWRQG
jgi:hypothetical protein